MRTNENVFEVAPVADESEALNNQPTIQTAPPSEAPLLDAYSNAVVTAAEEVTH